MKILVTGSSGHLGEALVRRIRKTSHSCVGIDIRPSEFTTDFGSITDREFVTNILKCVDFVLHTASLHKPHIATHKRQDFISTNITGTLNLLEASVANNVKAFIYTSTTSTFGDMLTPSAYQPARWINEQTRSIPKNIYGVTKNAAEDICQLFNRNYGLPCLILKTSRFFPEEDDNKHVREQYEDLNIKANEYLYRRVDIEDAVSAHVLAFEKVEKIGFGKYIISATSPFKEKDLTALNSDAISVVNQLFPDFREIYDRKGWKMLPRIDRIYVNEKARNELAWIPKYDFAYILNRIKKGKEFQSKLSKDIGIKGYHKVKFDDGPYPVTG